MTVLRLHRAGEPVITSGLVESGGFGPAGVFLRPGDWLFSGTPVRVTTLLGSCVAVMLWSPVRRIGAMCHCMLPQRRLDDFAPAPDGRYGEEAAQWMEMHLARCGVGFGELEATLAGGASVHGWREIGEANLRWARDWLAQRGIAVVQQDVGGRVVRRVSFNLADGGVTVAHGGRVPAQEN